MQLEDETSILSTGGEMTARYVKDTVFFKIVDNNQSHQTFLGTTGNTKGTFDFMAQLFSIRHHEFESSSSNEISKVVLGGARERPVSLWLSNVPYVSLSTSLKIWTAGDVGYHVNTSMCPGW